MELVAGVRTLFATEGLGFCKECPFPLWPFDGATAHFYGTSANAVKTQIWIAVSVYVLVAIVRKRLGIEASLYQLLQIFSVTLFEKTPILRALQRFDSQDELLTHSNQLILFDF